MTKSQNQTYWFKRRRYGYGWTPTAWQGWVTVLLFLVIVLGGTYFIGDTPRNTFTTSSIIYLVCVLASIAMLLVVGYLKGPKPKWRWGSKPGDNPREDI